MKEFRFPLTTSTNSPFESKHTGVLADITVPAELKAPLNLLSCSF